MGINHIFVLCCFMLVGCRTEKLKKRSVSNPRFVELLVVADETMVDFYADDDLTSYLLTLMSSVS